MQTSNPPRQIARGSCLLEALHKELISNELSVATREAHIASDASSAPKHFF